MAQRRSTDRLLGEQRDLEGFVAGAKHAGEDPDPEHVKRLEEVKAELAARDAPGFSGRDRLRTQRLSDIQEEEIEWLWPGLIPKGTLTMLDGRGGVGKSTVAFDLAARVSSGRPMPGEEPSCRDPGAVIVINAEDHQSATIRPRCATAGANLDLIEVPDVQTSDRQWKLVGGVDALEERVRELAAAFVIIDPIASYLEGMNMKSEQDMRACLHPLAEMAKSTRCAVLGLRHLNKGSSSDPSMRAMGSVAIGNMSRSALLAGQPLGEPSGTRRVLAQYKTNLGPLSRSRFYEVTVSLNGVAQIEWGEETAMSAEDLIGEPGDADETSERAQMAQYMRDICERSDSPFVIVNHMRSELRKHGFFKSEKTMQRAARDAGLVTTGPKKRGGPRSYYLPERVNCSVDSPSVSTLGVHTASSALTRENSRKMPSVDMSLGSVHTGNGSHPGR